MKTFDLFVYLFVDLSERFSFECRKVIGFASTTLHDWPKKFTFLIQSGVKPKTILSHSYSFFLPFASAACNYFKLWLAHCIVCIVVCDWLEWLLWFWFHSIENFSSIILICIFRREVRAWISHQSYTLFFYAICNFSGLLSIVYSSLFLLDIVRKHWHSIVLALTCRTHRLLLPSSIAEKPFVSAISQLNKLSIPWTFPFQP